MEILPHYTQVYVSLLRHYLRVLPIRGLLPAGYILLHTSSHSLPGIEGVKVGLAGGVNNCGIESIALDIVEAFFKWSEICGRVSGEMFHMKHTIPAAE